MNVCVCFCLWLHAAFISLPTLPRVCILGSDPNLLGLSLGKEQKNVRAGVVDVAMTCMTLEGAVVIVSRPSPWGHWLVQSCTGRAAQQLSICTLPHCGTFPHRVSTLTSFVNVHRGVLGGLNYLNSCFCSPIKTGYRKYNVTIITIKHFIDQWKWTPRHCHWNRSILIHIFFKCPDIYSWFLKRYMLI